MFKTLVNEFRDQAATALHPFAPESAGFASGFPTGAFIDALIAVVSGDVQPYVSKLAYIGGVLEIEISGSSYSTVATGSWSPGQELIELSDKWGRPAGFLLPGPALEAYCESISNVAAAFTETWLPFAAGTIVSDQPDGLLGVSCSDGYSASGDIAILAGSGLHFESTGSGTRLSCYGEMRSLDIPLKTVNGVSYEKLWLSAIVWSDPSVDCAIRLQTKTDITIGKDCDFGYGTA